MPVLSLSSDAASRCFTTRPALGERGPSLLQSNTVSRCDCRSGGSARGESTLMRYASNVARVSQALRVGEPERTDIDGEGKYDGLLMMEDAMCFARFSRVKGSDCAWLLDVVLGWGSNGSRGGVLSVARSAGWKFGRSAMSVVLFCLERARFGMLTAYFLA